MLATMVFSSGEKEPKQPASRNAAGHRITPLLKNLVIDLSMGRIVFILLVDGILTNPVLRGSPGRERHDELSGYLAEDRKIPLITYGYSWHSVIGNHSPAMIGG